MTHSPGLARSKEIKPTAKNIPLGFIVLISLRIFLEGVVCQLCAPHKTTENDPAAEGDSAAGELRRSGPVAWLGSALQSVCASSPYVETRGRQSIVQSIRLRRHEGRMFLFIAHNVQMNFILGHLNKL